MFHQNCRYGSLLEAALLFNQENFSAITETVYSF
jgi:hypothetical protein